MSPDPEGQDDAPTISGTAEVEINALLGMFDAPAFIRRGHDLDHALNRLGHRLDREREGMLDMVRLRLRQWAAVATGPADHLPPFLAPIAPWFVLAAAEPPVWADRPGPDRRRRAIGADLTASIARFNRRWAEKLGSLRLDTLNRQIDHYNQYYVLEKECVLGSTRLAARHFAPKPLMTLETLLGRFPVLPEIDREP